MSEETKKALESLANIFRDSLPEQWEKHCKGYLEVLGRKLSEPVPMILNCPECGKRHIDKGKFATKVHHTHACQHCGMVWRPAVVPTFGVQFLPGFKDEE